MSPFVRNLFLLFGVASIAVMLLTFDVDYETLVANIGRAGLYFPAVLGVWVIVYAFNARAFQIIVNSGSHERHLSYRHAYKLTVSGFAFSYTTPFGFGGGPYRVMELSSYIGTCHAISSVALYSMMHILSHFCLWSFAALLFVILHTELMTPLLWALLGGFVVVVLAVFVGFAFFYRKGVIERLIVPLLYVPVLRRWSRKFYESHLDQIRQIDEGIALLHSMPRAFWASLAAEFVARLVNSLEYWFILLSLGVSLGLSDAIFILAFSSLMGNLLFFFPMQLGAREGGLLLILGLLHLSAPGMGVLTGLYTRVRETVWVLIGVALVKVGNKQLMR